MRAICLGAVSVIFALLGCQDRPPPELFVPVSVEGITVPGGFEQAKLTGFTACEAGYHGYSCKRTHDTEVFGVRPVGATLRLNGDQNFQLNVTSAKPGDTRNLKADQLSYRSVDLEFAKDQYDTRCLKAKGLREEDHSETCVIVKGVQAFIEGLKKADWVLVRSVKGHDYFLHAGMPIEISVTMHKSTATFRPEPADSVRRRLDEAAQALKAEALKRANTQEVLQRLQTTGR